MKNLKSIGFLALVIAPIILFGYQNCANLESGNSSRSTHPPILFSSLGSLGYSFTNNCTALSDGPIMMINEESHLCAISTTMCQSTTLGSDGFEFDSNNLCEEATEYTSPELIESFSTSTAAEEGFVVDPNQMCTFQIQTMVNVRTRTCVEATNGCQAAYLRNSQGFTTDTASLCR